MDYGKSITFVFEDEEWVNKVLVGAVFAFLSLFLIGIPFIIGYGIELVSNVRKGVPKPLPKWDNLGQKFADGLLLTIGYLVYWLPVLLVWLPFWFLALLFSGNTDLPALISLGLNCVTWLWGIAVALLTPAIVVRYAETRNITAIFRLGDIIGFTTKHIGPVIIVTVIGLAVSMLASTVGAMLCGIGLAFTMFWYTLVQAHLYAQVGLEPQPTAVTPDVTVA